MLEHRLNVRKSVRNTGACSCENGRVEVSSGQSSTPSEVLSSIRLQRRVDAKIPVQQSVADTEVNTYGGNDSYPPSVYVKTLTF